MDQISKPSSFATVHPSVFTKNEIEGFERLLSDCTATEHDVSKFFSQFPKFLWMGSGAELRREVLMVRNEFHSRRRVDFFRRSYGSHYWDIIELKSPSKNFALSTNNSHPRLSAAVNIAIAQAQDYRDWIIEDPEVRLNLAKAGIIVSRPQIIVIVGRESASLTPEALSILQDRVRSGPIEAWSYDAILRFAKEHYSANAQILLPSFHYVIQSAKDIQLALETAGFDRIYVYELSVGGTQLEGVMCHGDTSRETQYRYIAETAPRALKRALTNEENFPFLRRGFIGRSLYVGFDDYIRNTMDSAIQDPQPHLYKGNEFRQEWYRSTFGGLPVPEWTEIPLMFSGRIVGLISADNAITKKKINRRDMDRLMLIGRLASQAIAIGGIFEKS